MSCGRALVGAWRFRLLFLNDALDVTVPVEDANDEDGLRLGPEEDDVRANGKLRSPAAISSRLLPISGN
jgi:hypothetical protein